MEYNPMKLALEVSVLVLALLKDKYYGTNVDKLIRLQKATKTRTPEAISE